MNLSERLIHDLEQYSDIKSHPKHKTLLAQGQVSTVFYFVLKGCLRQYHLTDGTEKTTLLYIENQFVVPFESILSQTPSESYLQCIEECTLVTMTLQHEQLLYERHPELEKTSRILLQEELIRYNGYRTKLLTMKPYERYMTLLKTEPGLANRVPGKYLATFLGIQPESLSRLRKKALLHDDINRNQF